MTAPPRRLGAFVDGVAMPEADAVAFWERFSTWMEEHRGDLQGFAAQEGYASVHPGVAGDLPVLRASTTGAQRPYAPVRDDGGGGKRADHGQTSSGGSPTRQKSPSAPAQQPPKTRAFPRKAGK